MPATASPFDAPPATDALDSTIATLPRTVALPTLDVDPAQLGRQLSSAAPTGLDEQLRAAMPDLSGAPSPAAFQRTLDEPLAGLT
ncbi:MAG TPA: hypothetical protein VFR81_09790, partial [Longimicrobium sp.]|nr:hypothetical protein [Longimicrobium sp.]